MIDFQALGVIVAIMVSLGTLYLSWRKAPHDVRNVQADTGEKVTEAAIQLLEPLQQRISELELARERDKVRISELERRVTELECELRDERNAKDEIRTGAERLVHQVESLGAKPVYTPPRRGGTGELKQK